VSDSKCKCNPFLEAQGSVPEFEAVDRPHHYTQGSVEAIEAIRSALGSSFGSYCWGTVLKYLWRWPHKGGAEDLRKARTYLDWLIDFVEHADGD